MLSTRTLNRAVYTGCALAVIALVTTAGVSDRVGKDFAEARSAAVRSYEAAHSEYIDDLTRIKADITTSTPTLAAAAAKLAESEGKTLDGIARNALASAVTFDTVRLATVSQETAARDAGKGSLALPGDTTNDQYDIITRAMDSYEPAPLAFDYTGELAAVDAAVTAWNAEQERLAAEAAAAAQAAAEAAEQSRAATVRQWSAASSDIGGGSSAQVAASSSGFVKNVWTAGSQSELDVCNGAVALYTDNGLTVAGEHWSCGGRNFPRDTGAVVTFTGYFDGTYRVIGVPAYLDAAVHSTDDIPRGYDLLFQTCIDGSSSNMALIALERI